MLLFFVEYSFAISKYSFIVTFTGIDENFKKWIFKQNAGQHNRFTNEQMDWLRMIKDHVVSSYHIELDDLDYTPFDSQGGKGKMFKLFGNEMNNIIDELNEVLAA